MRRLRFGAHFEHWRMTTQLRHRGLGAAAIRMGTELEETCRLQERMNEALSAVLGVAGCLEDSASR